MSEKLHKGMIGIYQIKNTVTGDVFIGATLSFGNRFKQDFSSLLLGEHSHAKLQASWSKYSPTDFEFSVLELCSHKSELQPLYAKWLSKTDSYALTPTKSLLYSVSGHVSVNKDVKEEIRRLDIGTFDKSVRILIDSYRNSIKDND